MEQNISLLLQQVQEVRVRRLNHGYADSLFLKFLGDDIYVFQVEQVLGGQEEYGRVVVRQVEDFFHDSVKIDPVAFAFPRTVKKLCLETENISKLTVGYLVSSIYGLPIVIAPGNIVGSLCLFGLENRGKENGLELPPQDYSIC
ncbi:MAG: hypothetical protein CL955_06385 [Erythrobacteraceae bacterium]|nr:hypothetical protein [Erythrobacteraceae bacterium]|tara:strand:+ start:1021 stop:1452 length:432 start_codon:yes stop_codon:yes gene_type:complete